MKGIITIIASALVYTAVNVQAENTDERIKGANVVKGVVLDSLSRQGEAMAVLQFFSCNDSQKPIAFTTTDMDGYFSHPIEGSGKFYLLYDNIGRVAKRIDFSLDGSRDLDLGTILVSDDVQTLESASVTAQRILVKMDVEKMTYDVENDDDAKTSTVLEMLRKIPMVSVDGQDNISVNGSSSFKVTVDGKPNSLFSSNPSRIFKTMPASSVKSIQVITNPGVKYDAEGVGGVLNLEMASTADGSGASADGHYGSVSLQGGTHNVGAGLYFSQQVGKFAYSINGNIMRQALKGMSSETVRNHHLTDGSELTTVTSQTYGMSVPVAIGNFSASYEIDSLNLVSATAGLMRHKIRTDGEGHNCMGHMEYDTDLSSTNKFSSLSADIDYQHKWAEEQRRIFTLSWQFEGNPQTSMSTNGYDAGEDLQLKPVDMQSAEENRSFDNTIQADFTTPMLKKACLNSGLKYINRHYCSDARLLLWDGSEFVLDSQGSTEYDFLNRIAAIYGELSGEIGGMKLKAGVRYEHTWQRVSHAQGKSGNFKTDYGILVPTASIQYDFGPTSNIGLSYNMRIRRPDISQLNPYVDMTDPTALSYGNPDLDVEKSHNLSLVYNFMSPKFIMNLTGRCTLDGSGISSYSFMDGNGLMNNTYGNIVKSSNFALNAFVNYNPTGKTRIMLNGAVQWADFRSDALKQSNSGASFNAMLGVQQTLPADFRLSVNLIGMGRRISLQAYDDGMALANLGLTKAFLDDRLSVSISGISNFNKGKMLMKSHISGNDFDMVTTTGIPIRQLVVSAGFTFGRQGISVKKTSRDIKEVKETETGKPIGLTGGMGGGLLGL